jgi:hypothetical protein
VTVYSSHFCVLLYFLVSWIYRSALTVIRIRLFHVSLRLNWSCILTMESGWFLKLIIFGFLELRAVVWNSRLSVRLSWFYFCQRRNRHTLLLAQNDFFPFDDWFFRVIRSLVIRLSKICPQLNFDLDLRSPLIGNIIFPRSLLLNMDLLVRNSAVNMTIIIWLSWILHFVSLLLACTMNRAFYRRLLR